MIMETEIKKLREMDMIDPETGEITLKKSPVPEWLLDGYDEIMRKRFISGTGNEYKVKKSLELGKNSRLFSESILLAENQAKYAEVANALFQKKLVNLRRNEKAISAKFRKVKTNKHNHYPTDDHSIAEKRLRLLTIIHSVSALNVNDAISDVKKLIAEFTKLIRKCKGMSCYAVVEVEVISYRNMKLLKEYELKKSNGITPEFDVYREKEHRKLNNFELLGAHLGEDVLNGEDGQLCIHLHALITAKTKSTFSKFQVMLESNKIWSVGSRIIKMNKFSEEFRGKVKPVAVSLENIARYITKGGCILNEGRPYLHYKVNAPNDILTTYHEYLNSESIHDDFSPSDSLITDEDFLASELKYEEFINSDLSKYMDEYVLNNDLPTIESVCEKISSDHLKNETKNKKRTTDFLSLSPLEINVLNQVNHLMINLNNAKTGHIIKIGHW